MCESRRNCTLAYLSHNERIESSEQSWRSVLPKDRVEALPRGGVMRCLHVLLDDFKRHADACRHLFVVVNFHGFNKEKCDSIDKKSIDIQTDSPVAAAAMKQSGWNAGSTRGRSCPLTSSYAPKKAPAAHMI